MTAVFLNELRIGDSNRHYLVQGNAKTITASVTKLEDLLNDLLSDLQSEVATCRVGISAAGHVTLDSDGGAVFSVTWTDTALRDLLGFTGNLAGANTYTAPRRVRGSLHLVHGGGPLPPTIERHDPQPELPHVSQTRALSGKLRSTRSGVVQRSGDFVIRHIDNTARLVSPAGAAGTTYASASSTELGLTLFEHARQIWWDSTVIACQGWSDGRAMRYFPSGYSIAMTAVPVTVSSSTYTTWVPTAEALRRFAAEPERPPQTASYRLTLPVLESL